MYFMPQQAVTKGYWKMEYFRAHPMARSSFEVKNPGPAPDSPAIFFCLTSRK